jgi:EmrB/QacA subfamily drug resistance transporter
MVSRARSGQLATRASLTYLVVIAGTILVLLDTTAVNVGLAVIGRALDAERSVRWIVSAYLLAVVTSQPLSGWLANRFGRKQVFMCSVGVFTAGSIGSALSPTLGSLIACRVVQGLGAGAILPVGLAIILELYPKSRHGRMLALWGMTAMIGPALGPTLGGWVTTTLSWHWLFLINVPLGIVTVIAAGRVIPPFPQLDAGALDVRGVVLTTSGLSLTVLGLSEAKRWGWTSPVIIGCLVIGALLLGVFVIHSLRTPNPVFDVRIFRVRSFRQAMVITFSYLVGQTARLVFVPLQLQLMRDITALRVGVILLPSVACQSLAFILSGRLVDRYGRRVPMVLGCTLCVAGLLGLAGQTPITPMIVICVFVSLQAIGSALCGPPSMVAVGDLSRPLMPHGSAARALIQQVSSIAAVAGLGALVDSRLTEGASPAAAQSAYNMAYAGAAVCALGGLILAANYRYTPAVTTEDADEAELEGGGIGLAPSRAG